MDIFRRRAEAFGAEFVDLETIRFTPDLLRCIPADVARRCRVLPVADLGNYLAIVMADPSDIPAVDGLRSALAREIVMRVAAESQIDSFIERLYGEDLTNEN